MSGLECTCVNNDDCTVLVSGGGRCPSVSMCTVWPSHSKWLSKESNESASQFALSLNIPPQKLFEWFRRPQLWATGDGQLHHDNAPTHASHLMQSFLAKRQITQVTQPHYSPDLAACNFCFFPKIKSPLKGKRFHIINKIQENTTGQLMAIRRTVWGRKVPTLKGTEASLSYVQCFLCLYLLQKCLYFFILYGWIPSGQTSYIFFTLLFSFSLRKYPEVGFLDYTEVLFLIFWGSSIVFSIIAVNLHS